MDRLRELKENVPEVHSPSIIETKELETNHQQFLSEIESINESLHELSLIVIELRQLSESVIHAVLPQREEYYSNLFSENITRGNQLGRTIKTRIQECRQTQTEEVASNFSQLDAESRMRDNLLNTITIKYSHVMKQYQGVQTQAKVALRRKVARQISMINPDITEAEVEQTLQQNSSSDYIKSAIMKSPHPSEAIQNAYQVAQGKYEDMKLLERSISDLQQLFVDLGTITTTQGEFLDQIEYNVDQAKEYVEEANVELREATSLLISAQARKACLIVFALLIIGLVIALAVVGSRGNLQH